ncbi:hypothetical protein N9B98_00875 [bacterium]|nr:hypothetical protein [bacterium]
MMTAIAGQEGDIETKQDRQLKQLYGFLFSLIMHLMILIVLALVLIPSAPSDPLVISLATADNHDPWANTEEITSMTSVDVSVPKQEPPESNSAIRETVTIDTLDLVEVPPITFPITFPGTEAETSNSPSETTGESGNRSKQNKSIKFFGAEAYGNSFVFVLDVSSSMSARNGQRLTRATSELIGSINQLTAEQDFCVILYSNHALPMFLKNNEAVMRQATPSNKQAALTWLRYQVRPQGGTMPARALQIAGNLKPDAVFFLSDGEFLYGHTADFNSPLNSFFQSFGQARKAMPPPGDVMLDPKSILSDYAPEIVVHTIAFESVGSRPLMELIAEQNGGQHRFIAAP